ncbi:C4-dicarboxylate TRAP transporter substrate-binding protein [Anaerotalea alkaliphila]|uniref:C4-dicarboxylate ABC transporter substrate-binding protein n=1 Tax=Anaerotalea alkaliphila TaxID=2662126 RepID=A0A7X5HX63_9FIRM|nr:C4-dicarboxylate TRAP transporter substrate-binding protein [Anaerotalea alkaliphila]NDL68304.1 C4-dicarboxylate ABC transporter substrate-binding protein [Anaerotalea alkaliphila]
MKKIIALALALTLGAATLAGCGQKTPDAQTGAQTGTENSAAPAADGKVYTLKMSTQMADSHPMVEGFRQLGKNLEEKSGGRLVMEVFPSAQLGSDEDVIEQAIQGVNVAVLTDGGRMGNYVNDIGIIGMPYLTDDYEDILKITQSDIFKGWEQELADDNGIRVLAFNFYDGARHFLTNKPVTKPEDLAGVRIRTPGAPVWSESIKALGATPVAMPWTEVYSAVQQKAIDGAESQYTASYSSRIYEVLKYVDKTGHFQLINGIIVGEKWFETLPEDLQTLLLEEAKAVATENARMIAGMAEEYEEKMVAEGMEIVEVDLDAFKQAADAAYETLGFTELREEIYSQIGK